MASGFRIAEAFVSVKADSDGLRGEVDRAVKEAGAGQDIKVGLKVDKADLGGLMSNLAPFIIPTVAAVSQLTGVLGLVPAAAGAAGLAYGTLKVGMSNFADSLKTGDTPAQLKAANEALADLSPNARAAALTVRGLGPAWDSVKLDVQNRLFAGMSSVINQVAKADLPVLRGGMDQMAGSLNLAAKYTGDWLASAKTTADIKTIFENSSVAGQNLARSIQPILGIIRDVAAVGSQFLPQLTGGFANAAQKAADFVSNARDTGKLHEWIQTGIDAVKTLWGSFTDLLDIIKQISQNSGPVNMLDILKLVTSSVRWLLDNFPELIPIIEGILVVMKLWKIAQLALNAVTEANPWVLLVTAIAVAAYEIYTHWDQVKKFLDATWQWIKATSDAVWTAIKDFFASILKSIHDTAVSVWNSIKDFFTGIWNSIRDTATSIWNGIAGFFTTAFNNYRNNFQNVWNAISGFFTGIWNTIRDTATNVWNGISGFLTGALNNFKGFFSGVWNGIVGDFNNIWGRVTGIAQNIWNSVVRAFHDGVNSVIGLINSLVNGADTVLGFLHIALIPHVPALAGGGTVGKGFTTNGPMAIVGEGNPAHPEYVIPTDPAHRGNALALYQSLGAKLMAGGGIIDWIGSTVSKVEKWAGAGATGLMNQAVDGLAGGIPAGMFRDVAVGVGHNIVAAIKALVDSAQTAFSAAFTGSPDLAGWIQAALGLTGTPGTWAGPLSVLIGRESGGNPNAINRWDSNAAAGHPSQGLMQTIPGTFNAYHQAGTSWNILDPVANIAAGINYIKARYGCMLEDVQILTKRGWLKHNEIQIGDQTIGYNPTTGRSEWTEVTQVHHYADAPVVRLYNSEWETVCTPTHRWVSETRKQVPAVRDTFCQVCGDNFPSARGAKHHMRITHGVREARELRLVYEPEFVETANIRQQHMLKLAAPADTTGSVDISDAEAELLGWMCGDGHVRTWRPGGKHRMTLYQAKPGHVLRIRALVADLPHTENVYEPRKEGYLTRHEFQFGVEYADDLIARSGYVHHGPEAFVLSLSTSQRSAWLRGVVGAEGQQLRPEGVKGRSDAPGWSITQINGPVLEAMKLAVYLEGHRPAASVLNKGTDGRKPSSTVVAGSSRMAGGFLKQEDAGIRNVWCVTTELGSWTAQDDSGRMFLTGNSIFNVQQANPNLPPKGYDAGGLLPTGLSLVRNSTGQPERVLNATQTAKLDRLLAGRGGVGSVTVNVTQVSGSPAETGRFVALALRTVG